jgi:hypothetical protein
MQDFVEYRETARAQQGHKQRKDRILIIHSDSVRNCLACLLPACSSWEAVIQ